MSISTSTNAAQTIKDVLEYVNNNDTSLWTHDTPEIYLINESTSQGRLNRATPAIYLFSPGSSDHQDRRAEGDKKHIFAEVEIQCWVLDSEDTGSKAIDYLDDVEAIIDSLNRDNEDRTQWHSIKIDNIDDTRREHVPRDSKHHVTNLLATLDRSKEVSDVL